jgi:hypothetical protein
MLDDREQAYLRSLRSWLGSQEEGIPERLQDLHRSIGNLLSLAEIEDWERLQILSTVIFWSLRR